MARFNRMITELTPRERIIVVLSGSNVRDREIAEALNTSQESIRTLRGGALRKLSARESGEATTIVR